MTEQALEKRQPNTMVPPPETVELTPECVSTATKDEKHLTPQEQRQNAVADALRDAYANASTLKLTKEESDALAADFPDDAFLLGAGGDKNLIYIEHSRLRQRLNSVLGIGQAVPIKRREWCEEKENMADVYVDLVLVVRGCLVGEAIGKHTYYKNNARMSYDDALESAKSNAFRRCCKEFGVGLQAWNKDWCIGWKERHLNQRFQQKETESAQRMDQEPVKTYTIKRNEEKVIDEKPAAKKKTAKPDFKKLRKRMFDVLNENGYDKQLLKDFAVDQNILPTESLEDWSEVNVPTNKVEMEKLLDMVKGWSEKQTTTDWWHSVQMPAHKGSIMESYKALEDKDDPNHNNMTRKFWTTINNYNPAADHLPTDDERRIVEAIIEFKKWHETKG